MARIIPFPNDPDQAVLAARRAAFAAVGHSSHLADGLDEKSFKLLLALFTRVHKREKRNDKPWRDVA